MEDIARQYNELQDDRQFHLTRQELCLNAISSVFNDIPAADQPFDGSTEQALKVLLPVLEHAFDMPALRPKRGTKEWFTHLTENIGEATFDDICQNHLDHPHILRAFIKYHKRHGDKEGRPRILSTDVLHWNNYKAGNKRDRPGMVSPRTVAPHTYCPHLRGVSHNYAIVQTRNAGAHVLMIFFICPDASVHMS